MSKTEVFFNKELSETTYKTTLKNGLDLYICKKEGFNKKIGMFGTKYGSMTNDFIDISTNKRVKVPDGIAHFLEHKLFEKKGQNALDLFSKIGVSANAYTSLDQTVFYFETIDKFEKSLELLVKLIKEPYFTDENVEKEKGIISQEIMMYEDDPNYSVYFNTLKAMYKDSPVRIDIAGTVESITNITKEMLYTCYHTFYSPQNMFMVIVGDIEVEDTILKIEKEIKNYEKNYGLSTSNAKIQKFTLQEQKDIYQKHIERKMDVYMPQMCIGYKMDLAKKDEIIKREVICDFISDMFFSRITKFYKEEYEKGILNDSISVEYEGGIGYSHVILSAASTNVEMLSKDLDIYFNRIRQEEIDEELFELTKKKKIGYLEFMADNLNVSYSRIIESIIKDVEDIYIDVKVLEELKSKDIKEFLNKLSEEVKVTSVIK